MDILVQPSRIYTKVTLAHYNALSGMSPGELAGDTKFIVDKINETGDYKTYLTDYSNISTAIVKRIEVTPNVNLSGHWSLSAGKTMCLDLAPLLVADKNYSDFWYKKRTDNSLSTYGNAAITYEYYEKVLLQKIYDLSVEIYTQQHVPSFVGMIIQSGRLASVEAVKNIYGKNTNWEKISFSYICGAGTNEEKNNFSTSTYGNLEPGEFSARNGYPSVAEGKEFVTLTDDNIPEHTHKFKAETQGFSMAWSGELKSTLSDKNSVWTFSHTYYRKGDHGPYHRAQKLDLGKVSTTVSGSESYSTRDLYGSNRPILSEEVWTSSGYRVNTTATHANMPPFITKYVWKRIS